MQLSRASPMKSLSIAWNSFQSVCALAVLSRMLHSALGIVIFHFVLSTSNSPDMGSTFRFLFSKGSHQLV